MKYWVVVTTKGTVDGVYSSLEAAKEAAERWSKMTPEWVELREGTWMVTFGPLRLCVEEVILDQSLVY